MSNHIQISFSSLQPEQQDILIAHLAEIGFESFEEKETELCAYISEQLFDESLLNNLAFKYQIHFQKKIIAEKNWNELWESHFHPVVIDDFVAVRADFHSPVPGVQHEIIITPKMSFGTGHHATTRMMILQMRQIDFKNKTVLDFGTGTGILAILARKLGAKKITAADIDDWSIQNALENFQRNDSTVIKLLNTSLKPLKGKFDVILANINKNTILENFPSMAKWLNKKGILLLSGLMIDDEIGLLREAETRHFDQKTRMVDNSWLCIRFDN